MPLHLDSLTAQDTRRGALDEAVLARLAELDPTGSAGLVDRVLRTYAGSLGRMGDQLERARESGDHAGLRFVTHTLKSSSASVGALVLSTLCGDIEQRVRDGQLGGLDPLLDRLLAELASVRAGVEARLAA